jgi:hypothetical protein
MLGGVASASRSMATVPGAIRRETGVIGEYLPQILVYLRDIGLKGNQRTLKQRGTSGNREAGP